MNLPADSAVPPHEWNSRSRHQLSGRLVGISLGISAVVNVLAVLLYAIFWGNFQPVGVYFPAQVPGGGSSGGGGMQVIRIVETTGPTKPVPPRQRPVVPQPRPQPVQAAPQPGHAARPGAGGEKTGAGEEGAGAGGLPSAAERLRPNPTSKRLWAPVNPALERLTPSQRMELALSGRLQAWQDSVARADSAAASATDWTYTDKSGGKWGVTPGELHLGKFTLPLPFSFGTTPGKRAEAERRTWEWNDIQRQISEQSIREGWKARAKAIRERRDKERAAAKADSSATKH